MNKTILIIILALGALGCKKEKVECTCGVIANDGITDNCYWLEIRNDCSGNKKIFCFDEDVWMNGHPGDKFCVANVESW